jgi:hypothetical protein
MSVETQNAADEFVQKYTTMLVEMSAILEALRVAAPGTAVLLEMSNLFKNIEAYSGSAALFKSQHGTPLSLPTL